MFSREAAADAVDVAGALPPAYRPLLERATAVLEDDPRVRAAWVHGSVARGDADAASDLDLIAAVDDDALAGFGREWRERLDAITPTLMARRFPGPGGSWLSITPTCERLDVWIEQVSAVATSVVRDRSVLFDRGDLDRLVPPPSAPAPRSDVKLAALRDWDAVCRATAAVADPLLETEVLHTLRWILYEAYVETNRPIPTTGLKQWSAKLTPAQRASLERLPTRGSPEPVLAELDAVLGAPGTPLPGPDLGRAVFPPEGVIRALVLTDVSGEARARHVAEEFLAIHLYLALVVHRGDWLLGLDGVHLLRKLLYELDLEEAGRTPATSPSDWSGRLTAEQRAELLSLPTGDATPRGVVDAHLAVRDAFVTRGRRVLGDAWPFELEQAVTRYVDARLPR